MLDTLGQYKILDRIGASRLGEIYRARDTHLGRTVALTVLSADLLQDPETRSRFLRDARMATALSHPNIAALYEIAEDQGQLFLAHEFVPGQSLSTIVARHPMPARLAIDLGAQLADALADAHAAGMAHGELSGEHVTITPKGNAKVLNFGLSAWASGQDDRSLRTDYGRDVRDLGAVLFRMLTGTAPGDSPIAPSVVSHNTPSRLDTIVLKALAAGERGFQSAATLAAELRSVASDLDDRVDFEEARVSGATWQEPSKWTWAALVAVVMAAGLWWGKAPAERVWKRLSFRPPPPIVALVPLRLDTADTSQTYYADGVTEDLAESLGRTSGIQVRGRSSLRRDRGRPPADVASELGAAVVVTGLVRPQADPMTLSLALVVASDGRSFWSADYSLDPADIFAVLAKASSDVAGALGLEQKPTAANARAAARVVVPAAYRLYLQARQAVAAGRVADAAHFYQEAASDDAGLAEAFAGFALTSDPGIAGRRDAAERALQLDPDLPEANLAMAAMTTDLSGALKYLRKAAEQDPSNGMIYLRIADRIRPVDPARAKSFETAALAADPRLENPSGVKPVDGPPEPEVTARQREEVRTALEGLLE
jgi:TolB-like protein/tRNA A-37 threonylcarbamoyl transferase component Bud32